MSDFDISDKEKQEIKDFFNAQPDFTQEEKDEMISTTIYYAGRDKYYNFNDEDE